MARHRNPEATRFGLSRHASVSCRCYSRFIDVGCNLKGRAFGERSGCVVSVSGPLFHLKRQVVYFESVHLAARAIWASMASLTRV